MRPSAPKPSPAAQAAKEQNETFLPQMRGNSPWKGTPGEVSADLKAMAASMSGGGDMRTGPRK